MPRESSWNSLTAPPPRTFLRYQNTGAVLSEEAAMTLIESIDGQIYPSGQYETATHMLPLKTGATFIHNGEACTLFVPNLEEDTAIPRLNLAHSDLRLEIDSQNLCAIFSSGEAETEIHGESIRALLAYASVRSLEHYPEGGWLNSDEVFSKWLELGGNKTSSKERLGWERGKIRTLLSGKGTVGTKHLFELKRKANAAEVRLNILAKNITIT